MKKNNKIKFKDISYTDESTLNDIDDLISNALLFEFNIRFKKENNLPLSSIEQYIDSCLIPPSRLLEYINGCDKE